MHTHRRQGVYQMARHRVKVLLLNLQPGVGRLPIAATILAGAAQKLNQKRRLMFPQGRDVDVGKKTVSLNPAVRSTQ